MTNIFAESERLLWNTIWQAAGSQTALYKPGNSDIEVILNIVPSTPKPDDFGFEDFKLYKTSRIFTVGVAELNGHIPKEGDKLIYNNIEYAVKKTSSGPCYDNVGNYNVMLKIHGSKNRIGNN